MPYLLWLCAKTVTTFLMQSLVIWLNCSQLSSTSCENRSLDGIDSFSISQKSWLAANVRGWVEGGSTALVSLNQLIIATLLRWPVTSVTSYFGECNVGEIIVKLILFNQWCIFSSFKPSRWNIVPGGRGSVLQALPSAPQLGMCMHTHVSHLAELSDELGGII